jgi:SAM-dependent methyltransferase
MTQDSQEVTGARGERAHAEFLGATWTSFDRYARYGALARAVRANLGPGVHKVLDVGDGSGYLRIFDPDLIPISIDLSPSPEPLPGAIQVIGDGLRLPVRDDAFAAVISSDALEHVPAMGRANFLQELVRVSRDLVVVAAPFDMPGVAGAEELVRRYALLSTGRPQEQLDEHMERVLPSLAHAVATLEACGLDIVSVGNGNLHDWLLYMLLKFQLDARPALTPLGSGYDMLYNLLFAGRNEVGPFYRQVVIGRPAHLGAPVIGEALAPVENTPNDLAALVAALISANTSEASRQDTVPRLDSLQATVNNLQATVESGVHRLETRMAELSSKVAAIQGATDDVQYKMNRLTKLLRHPVQSALKLTKKT